ncbi:hypothetical protein EVAR_25310_1 [Eumeta japonica]|uniref:Uncharacterized protein n=1 Tax=Eumeta variegata TaxID=151549 RepID=A0A4C1VQ35_EUMVA|nr:hypothetical protein EVAR_25310_1 [Eumeta japonica]
MEAIFQAIRSHFSDPKENSYKQRHNVRQPCEKINPPPVNSTLSKEKRSLQPPTVDRMAQSSAVVEFRASSTTAWSRRSVIKDGQRASPRVAAGSIINCLNQPRMGANWPVSGAQARRPAETDLIIEIDELFCK